MTRRSVGRDVVLVLALKMAALSLIYLLFFRADMHPVPDAESVARHLLAAASASALGRAEPTR